MIPQNVFNPEKRGKIDGNAFHIFYMDLHTAVLFDKDLYNPIIWGSKNVVMTALKNINEEMNVKPDKKVFVYSYVFGEQGYRRIQTYTGPIENIGKYIIRY